MNTNGKKTRQAPEWVARFLDALGQGMGSREAAREAGVASSTPYHRRKTHPEFCAAWDAIQVVDGRKRAGPKRPRGSALHDRFLDELAETSNVARAAAVAGLDVRAAYRLRRSDPDFARRWYEALAEGYDNLEMELLLHLRGGDNGGDSAGDRAASGNAAKPKFDTATALRCLTAHRESVAREKGRRTLADEVATIASINARIDEMRARAKKGDAAVRKAHKGKANGKA